MGRARLGSSIEEQPDNKLVSYVYYRTVRILLLSVSIKKLHVSRSSTDPACRESERLGSNHPAGRSHPPLTPHPPTDNLTAYKYNQT